jgi:hypothetical protein
MLQINLEAIKVLEIGFSCNMHICNLNRIHEVLRKIPHTNKTSKINYHGQ